MGAACSSANPSVSTGDTPNEVPAMQGLLVDESLLRQLLGHSGFQTNDRVDQLLTQLRSAGTQSDKEQIISRFRSPNSLKTLARCLDFEERRLATLELSLLLMSDEFNTSASQAQAVLLDHVVEAARAFIYLTPEARCGGGSLCIHSPIRKTVYWSLALLTNLMAVEGGGGEVAGKLRPALPRLRQLARESSENAPASLAVPSIIAVAQRCLRNYALICGAGSSAETLEQAGHMAPSDLEDAGGCADGVRVPPPPSRNRSLGRVQPTRAPGFHDFAAPMQLSSLPLVPYREPSEGKSDGVCTICLDEFAPGQQLRVLPCLHRFHDGCIGSWVSAKAVSGRGSACRCPNCNTPIRALPG